jgi:hypothetical protein
MTSRLLNPVSQQHQVSEPKAKASPRPDLSRNMNMRILRPSRAALKAGDIFALEPIPGRYLFGRAIAVNLPLDQAPVPRSNLIYIYRGMSDTLTPPARLRPDLLLVPPMFVNRQPWLKGFLLTVEHRDVELRDLVRQYCFWDSARRRYVDENGAALPAAPHHDCGEWAMGAYSFIDDRVSTALGIPRAPRPPWPAGSAAPSDIPER